MVKKNWREERRKFMEWMNSLPDAGLTREEREAKHAARLVYLDAVQKPVFEALERAGFVADDWDHLMYRYVPYPRALVDVLLEWLTKIDQRNILEMMVRGIGATREPYDGRPLADLFDRSDSFYLKWPIGNTISLTTPTGIDDWVLDTLKNPAHERAREMLCIAAARMQPERARHVLMEVFDQMPGFTSLGLRRCGGREELEFLRKKLASPESEQWQDWSRKRVEATIRCLERRVQSQERKKNKKRKPR